MILSQNALFVKKGDFWSHGKRKLSPSPDTKITSEPSLIPLHTLTPLATVTTKPSASASPKASPNPVIKLHSVTHNTSLNMYDDGNKTNFDDIAGDNVYSVKAVVNSASP